MLKYGCSVETPIRLRDRQAVKASVFEADIVGSNPTPAATYKEMKEQKKIYKTIPQSEDGIAVTNKTKSGEIFLITNCQVKGKFTLWKEVNGGYEKIAAASNPLEFDIPW